SRVAKSGGRRSRHWRLSTLSSISAMSSQLPCLGVWWIASLSASRLASAGGNASYFERAPHRLIRDGVGDRQFHQLVGQEPQRPARLAGRWLAAGERHQARFLRAVELAVMEPPGGAAIQGRLQALLDELLAHPKDRGLAALHR